MVNRTRDPKLGVAPAVSSQRRRTSGAALRDAYPPAGNVAAAFDHGRGGGVLGKLRKWSRRAFAERQILVRSGGRVSYITLSRRLQMTTALTASVAAMALLGYTATNSLPDPRVLFKHAPSDQAMSTDQATSSTSVELQARIDDLQRQLATANARLSQPATPADPDAEARIKALQEERDRAIAQQKALQSQLDAARQTADAKAQSLAQLNRTIEANRGELRQSDTQRSALQTRIHQLEGELDAAKRKIDQLAAEHDKSVAEREQLASRPPEPQQRGAPAAPGAAASSSAPSMDSVPAPASPPRTVITGPQDQHSDATGELEQLIASTGIDVEELLQRLSRVPPNQGGPYVPLAAAANAAVPAPDAQRSQELQQIVRTLPLAAPLDDYRLESGFGGRADPYTHRQAFHPGVDLVAPYRTPVRTTAAGVVTFTGVKSAYGKVVEVDHGHGIVTRYGHLHRIVVVRGQTVMLHQEVGELGSTGRSTGPHLHYEVLVSGTPQDPEKFLQAGKNVVQAISSKQ
jgi:murein DD-endopeptidase MepM/ murein hydrolase activator NlpD